MSASQKPAAKPPKMMSSRLLTMKFMQRAAASSPTSPATPDQQSQKRQKLSSPDSPSPLSPDLQAMQAAMAAEEAKRLEALDRQATEAGETRWVLSFQRNEAGENSNRALRVINTGFAGLDSPTVGEGRLDQTAEDGWRHDSGLGRRKFGRPQK